MKPTKAQIKRHNWWWYSPEIIAFTVDGRGRTERTKHPVSQFWKDGRESAAFRYELVRRLDRDRKLPPWLQLDNYQTGQLKAALGESSFIWCSLQSTDSFHEACKNPTHTEPIQFNLLATDSALEKHFRQFIAEQRKLKKVQPAKLPRKNAISWRWLEVWDLNEVDQMALTPSLHNMKSRARSEAEKFKSKVFEALAAAAAEKKFSPAWIRKVRG